MSSFGILKYAASRNLAPYEQEEEEENSERRKVKRTYADERMNAAKNVAIGAGLLAVGGTMIPTDMRRAMDRFSAGSYEWDTLKNPIDASKEYSEYGSDIVNGKLWGVLSPVTLLKGVRSVPGVPDKWKWKADSGEHYEAFGKGPISAYQQLVKEHFDVDGKEAGNGPLGLIRRFKNKLYTDRLGEHLNDYVESVGGLRDPGSISREKQKALFRGFDDYLRKVDPEFEIKKRDVDKYLGVHGIAHAGAVYRKTILNTLGNVPYLLGAAGAGLAGYGAYRLWKASKERKAKQKREELLAKG